MSKTKSISPTQAKNELFKVKRAIEEYLSVVGYEIDHVLRDSDPNEIFLRDEVHGIYNRLEEINSDIEYLNREVYTEGCLYINKSGRYEIDMDTYLTSGSVCEILTYDDFHEQESWQKTSIEHGPNGYYAVVLGKDVSIDGLRARMRK